ncbi:hypothetical protein NUW54_g5765 [Trametes sanguinea]|uniref:Uncharacterized protein n=1 Tax=Trametes sanguinea TaxID=158606 RepID=A0ACC1PU68_9APHY|nr:hypothetical protein NUW54_g5765 [Trametes sanguinea]
MADSFKAVCAVLLEDSHTGQLKYISTVPVCAPRTSPLADVFPPSIFQWAMAYRSLPSVDPNDYLYQYLWLPDRQVVDRQKPIRQRREFIEKNFCNDPSFVEYALPLASFDEFKTIEQKPDSLVIILSKYHATALVINFAEVHDSIKYRETIAKAARSRKSPSTEAHLSQLRATQTRNVADTIYNGRPLQLLGVPVTIYSSAFTNFQRIMADNNLEFTPKELKLIREIIGASVAFHPNEAERVKHMTGPLHRFLGYELLVVTEIPLSSGLIKPDGIVRATVEDHKVVQPLRCIVEVESEIGQGGCDPIAQAERCYRVFYSSEEAERLRAACCCPCLLIGMAGPRIMVSGAVFADTLLIQELSDYHSHVPRPTLAERSPYDQQIYETGRCLLQPDLALRPDLARSAGLALSARSLPSCSLNAYIGPQFTRFSGPDGHAVSLVYTGRLSDEDPSKAVFTAVALVERSNEVHDAQIQRIVGRTLLPLPLRLTLRQTRKRGKRAALPATLVPSARFECAARTLA